MKDVESRLTESFNIGSGRKIVIDGRKKHLGTLGLLVRKAGDGRSVYGLSSHFTAHPSDVYISENKFFLGSSFPIKSKGGESKEEISIDTLVSCFEINPGVKISALANPEIKDFKIISPREAFGKDVYKSDYEGNISFGFVKGIYSKIMAKSPITNEITVFNDIIEIEALGQGEFAKAGDAGALVSTLNGGIVGLVISGDDKACFISPLDGIFEKEKFVILNKALADQFNSNLSPEKVLTSLCKENPDLVVENFNHVRNNLNSFFAALQADNLRELENLQDKLAKEIFMLIGSKVYEKCWSELFYNDPWFDRAMRSITCTRRLSDEDCELIRSLLEADKNDDYLDPDSIHFQISPYLISEQLTPS